MTHLLGRQDCIDSLRRDLIDLQGAVLDVFSKTGPVRFPSWKFPDKLSCNLDLVSLLEEYDYVDGDEEFSQHSHIVLQELLIDRLMLLLQSFNIHAELLLEKQRALSSDQKETSVSIGPVVKCYWRNLLQLSCQQAKESTSNGQQPPSQQSPSITRTAANTTTINTHKTQSTSMTSIQKTTTNTPASTPATFQHERASAAGSCVSIHTVGCQTVESALVPCEACACVQAVMKESSDALVSLCQSLGLPCSIQGFLEAVEETQQLGRLSACDISQWASEQRRDMSRVGKHVLEVRETVEPLKKKLKETEMEREKLRKQLSETVKREKEERRKMEEEWECRMQEVKSRAEETVRRLKQEKEELKRGITLLEDRNSELTAELNLQTEAKQSLEYERATLQEEVRRLHSLENMLREVEESRQNLEKELRSTQTLLDKESAKNHSVRRQHEALQVKQAALRKHLDVLVQQTEDLHSSLEECEDEKADLANKLTQIIQEKDALQEQFTQQQSHCSSQSTEKQQQQTQITELKESVSHLKQMLEEASQRERILVAFPELNPQAAPQTTGDVMCDMEQQLKANSVRIRILQQENITLSNSLTRLKDREEKQRSSDSGIVEIDRSREAPVMGPLVNPSTPSSTSPSSILHHQTLCLSLQQDVDVEERYMNIRQAARIRSAGTRRRRK
ncbi:coiled-coil domain-containing protein 157 [Sinocyclocheilus rhinocerous]|uniref:coiled-coil domain-containing protein 157 n=1 Tax=Sinocyclocheilus rhinocerous TaxID=307959 RepID=UPI0007BA95FD|nr:PREDICTED: coiled-coil domain-containing protein 157 [Sinocyclocheilus rhinocerous]XP_016417123.1 PREDICTED: coiled-coil domain-containing protein 157 [Sinocyclocheilus rhinocerous]